MTTARYATLADLDELVPTTSTVADTIRQHYLDAAEQLIGLDTWGDTALFGHVQLTAHFLAQLFPDTVGGATGPVTSMAAGSISASFAVASVSSSSDADFQETAYGRRFLALRRSVFHGVGIASTA